jgi:hypothetical protein
MAPSAQRARPPCPSLSPALRRRELLLLVLLHIPRGKEEPIKQDKAKKVLSTHSLYLIISQDHQAVLVQTGHMVQS